MDPIKQENGDVFMGFLFLIILIGVVISIIVSSSAKIRITVDIMAEYEEVLWVRNRDEKYFAKS